MSSPQPTILCPILAQMRAKPRNFHHFLIENALDLALVYVVKKGDKLSDYE
jgi:hypothetical protein